MAWTGSQHDRNRRWGWTYKLPRFKQHVVILSLKPPEIYSFNLWILMVIIRFQSAWQMISQNDTTGCLFVRQPGSAVGKTIFCCIHMSILGTRKPFIDNGHKMTGARPNDFVLLQCAAKTSSWACIIGYDTFLLLSPTSIWACEQWKPRRKDDVVTCFILFWWQLQSSRTSRWHMHAANSSSDRAHWSLVARSSRCLFVGRFPEDLTGCDMERLVVLIFR